jgi:hypothetical protein
MHRGHKKFQFHAGQCRIVTEGVLGLSLSVLSNAAVAPWWRCRKLKSRFTKRNQLIAFREPIKMAINGPGLILEKWDEGCVPRQSRYNFLGDMEKAKFFGALRRMWPHNYDHYEWSRTSRKCQIQKEYGLYLHPLSSVAWAVFFNHWLSKIYAPICKSMAGCQCQRCLHLPTTLNPHHHPGDSCTRHFPEIYPTIPTSLLG